MAFSKEDKRAAWIFPLAFTALVFIIYHAVLSTNTNDDIYFTKVAAGSPVMEILKVRYNGWSSRVFIEFFTLLLARAKWLWRIIDVAAFVTLPILVTKLAGWKKSLWTPCLFVLLYPFYDMFSAGWFTTTCFVAFTLWGLLYACICLKKEAEGERLAWYEWIFGIFCCAYATNQEQCAAIMAVLGLYAAVSTIRSRRVPAFAAVCLIITAFMLVNALVLCPGNAMRTLKESENYWPNFAQAPLWQKLAIGTVNLFSAFAGSFNPIFLAFSAVLSAAVFKKTKSAVKTAAASLPLLISFIYVCVFSGFPLIADKLSLPGEIYSVSLKDYGTLFALLCSAALIASSVLALVWLADSVNEAVRDVIIFLAGGGSSVMLGLSPTVYASSTRIFMYFYFALIILSLKTIGKYGLPGEDAEKNKLLMAAGALVAATTFIYSMHFCLMR